MATCPINRICNHLIQMHGADASAALAQAIGIRMQPTSKLLAKSNFDAFDVWEFEQFQRKPSSLEHIIVGLARKADLAVRQPALMNMNPIEFANSFRDSDLHFLLTSHLIKLK